MAENAEYIVAVTQITTYVYVDVKTGGVQLVVADDTSLPDYGEMKYYFADEDCTPQDAAGSAMPTVDQIEWAKQAMKAQAWPAWEFSW